MNELLVFARAPRPGFVKTRLAAAIGSHAACLAYREMTEALAAHLALVPRATVLFSPSDALAEVQPLFPAHWNFAAQVEGDLGARMRAALLDAFARGSTRPVLIGTDSPELAPADIENAWRELGSHDVVFGPAEDGGYWLIGATSAPPGLFENIRWSEPSVLSQSLERCHTLGLKASLLRTLPDIDTADDWRRYQNKLSGAGNSRHHRTTAQP